MSRKNKFFQVFVDFIRILCDKKNSQVQNNGPMAKEFFWKRVLGKAVFSSLPCDVFSCDILKDNKIKGFNIPVKKEKLKLSQ